MHKFYGRYMKMTACSTSMQQHSTRCANMAAASTSARLYALLDTAAAAVSIFILLLAGLLIPMC